MDTKLEEPLAVRSSLVLRPVRASISCHVNRAPEPGKDAVKVGVTGCVECTASTTTQLSKSTRCFFLAYVSDCSA